MLRVLKWASLKSDDTPQQDEKEVDNQTKIKTGK